MLIAGLVVNVNENESVEICNYIQTQNIAEVPNIQESSSFACVIEADNEDGLYKKISQIEGISGVLAVSISYKADENDPDLDF